MQQTPSSSRNASQKPELTPVHRASRRIRGLAPEIVPRCTTTTSTGMEDTTALNPAATPAAAAAAAPAYYTLQKPRVPSPFRGGLFEDVEDWLAEFEHVADFNGWDEEAKLRNVYFSLLDGARTWFQNRKGLLTSWREFCRRLLDTYSNPDRRERAEWALQSRIQMPNEGVAMYVEDMVHLFNRANPHMPEDKKLRHLMRGVKEQLFGGLIRSPPKTVAEFLTEAVAMEKALQQRNQYDRQVNATYTTGIGSFPTDVETLRELIRSVVRDELRQLHQAQQQPTTNCIASIIRDEVQQALSAHRREAPVQVPAPLQAFTPSSEPPRVSYADALRRTVPSSVTPPPVSGFQHASYADTFGHISPATVPLPAASPYATLKSAQAVPYFEDIRPSRVNPTFGACPTDDHFATTVVRRVTCTESASTADLDFRVFLPIHPVPGSDSNHPKLKILSLGSAYHLGVSHVHHHHGHHPIRATGVGCRKDDLRALTWKTDASDLSRRGR